MTVTIDHAGRIVIPKAIREREGLTPGTAISLRAENGRIELWVPEAPVQIEQRDGLWRIVDPAGVNLTDAAVNERLRSLRAGRVPVAPAGQQPSRQADRKARKR